MTSPLPANPAWPDSPPRCAEGRSLGYFGKLSRAETRLLKCCQSGKPATIWNERPEKRTARNHVRATFVRFLALGGDQGVPLHEHGVILAGAWLIGELDLDAATLEYPLALLQCRIESIRAGHANLKLLDLRGSSLEKGLAGGGLHCATSIFLNRGFRSTGQIRLVGARIEGDLDCSGGHFENKDGKALSGDSARVGGRFLFRDFHPEKGETVALHAEGQVDLALMNVGALCDASDSWDGVELTLDGFTYGRITAGPTDSASRRAWLERQRSDHLEADFKPQPWEQLARVLSEMGHADEARDISVAKHEWARRAKRYVGGSREWDWLYGKLVGYGYRPWKLMKIALSVWAVCSLAYWAAVQPSFFRSDTFLLAPPRVETSASCLAERAAAGSTDPCPPAPTDYASFFAPLYSADVLFPVVSLGYRDDWEPVMAGPDGRLLPWGLALSILYWFEIVFGWIAGLLLVGLLGSLVKKD